MAFRIALESWISARLYRPCFHLGSGLIAVAAFGGLARDTWAERRLPPPDEQHFRKANSALEAGDFSRAAAEYRLGIRIRPDLDAGFLGLARVLAITGTMEERIENFRALLRVSPKHMGAHAALADLYDQQRRFDESLGHYLFLAAAEPADADLAFNLGLCLLNTRRPGEAARELLRAVELRPEDPRMHNALGVAWIEAGDIEDAARAFENAVRLEPGNDGYRRNLDKARAALVPASPAAETTK